MPPSPGTPVRGERAYSWASQATAASQPADVEMPPSGDVAGRRRARDSPDAAGANNHVPAGPRFCPVPGCVAGRPGQHAGPPAKG